MAAIKSAAKVAARAVAKAGAKVAPKLAAKAARVGEQVAARRTAKVAAKAVAKKARKPISKAQKDQWIIEGAMVAPLLGAEAVISADQARQLRENQTLAANRKYEVAATRKKGSPALGADKFSWAGRR